MQSIHTFTLLVVATALLSLLASFEVAQSVRNEREEAICQPFLTNRRTSPLVENDPTKPLDLRRDLKVDEDGDFACRLVLQVQYSPPPDATLCLCYMRLMKMFSIHIYIMHYTYIILTLPIGLLTFYNPSLSSITIPPFPLSS